MGDGKERGKERGKEKGKEQEKENEEESSRAGREVHRSDFAGDEQRGAYLPSES